MNQSHIESKWQHSKMCWGHILQSVLAEGSPSRENWPEGPEARSEGSPWNLKHLNDICKALPSNPFLRKGFLLSLSRQMTWSIQKPPLWCFEYSQVETNRHLGKHSSLRKVSKGRETGRDPHPPSFGQNAIRAETVLVTVLLLSVRYSFFIALLVYHCQLSLCYYCCRNSYDDPWQFQVPCVKLICLVSVLGSVKILKRMDRYGEAKSNGSLLGLMRLKFLGKWHWWTEGGKI